MTDTINASIADSAQDETPDFLKFELPSESEQTVYHDDVETEIINDDNESGDEYSANEYRGLLDEKGAPFDPSLHKSPPEKTAGGKWKRIPKREREQTQESGEIPEANATNRMEAQKAALVYAGLHGAIFPQDCKPSSEHLNMLTDSIEQYFNENGAIEMPAGLNVALAMGMYSQEIATRPTNFEKLKKWGKSLSEKWRDKRERNPTKKDAVKAARELDARSEKKEA